MTDEQFIAALLALNAKGASGIPEMREILRTAGGMSRLIALAAKGIGAKPARKAPEKPRAKMPDGFPTPDSLGAAVLYWQTKGRPDLAASVNEQAEQFRDHHAARGGKMLDWPAAWRTWIRNALEFTRPPAGRPAPVPASPEADTATWVRRLKYFHEGDVGDEIEVGFWSTKWGPSPAQAGCLAPKAALEAYEPRAPVVPAGAARGAKD